METIKNTFTDKSIYNAYLFCGMILGHQKEQISNMSNMINEISQAICWVKKKSACKMSYTVWFELCDILEEENLTIFKKWKHGCLWGLGWEDWLQ